MMMRTYIGVAVIAVASYMAGAANNQRSADEFLAYSSMHILKTDLAKAQLHRLKSFEPGTKAYDEAIAQEELRLGQLDRALGDAAIRFNVSGTSPEWEVATAAHYVKRAALRLDKAYSATKANGYNADLYLPLIERSTDLAEIGTALISVEGAIYDVRLPTYKEPPP